MSNARTRRIRGTRQGAVLLFALIVLWVASAISLAVFQSLMRQARTLARAERDLQARCLADAGEFRARRLRELDQNYTGDVWRVDVREPSALVGTHSSTTADLASAQGFVRQIPEMGQVVIDMDDARQQMEVTADYPAESAGRRRIRRLRPLEFSAPSNPSNLVPERPSQP